MRRPSTCTCRPGAPRPHNGRPRCTQRLPGRAVRLLQRAVHRYRHKAGSGRSCAAVRAHDARMGGRRPPPDLEFRPGLLRMQLGQTRPPARRGLDALAGKTKRAPDRVSPSPPRDLDHPARPGSRPQAPDPSAAPHRGDRDDPALETAHELMSCRPFGSLAEAKPPYRTAPRAALQRPGFQCRVSPVSAAPGTVRLRFQ